MTLRNQRWEQIYDSWLESKLTKRAFYDGRLRQLWPADQELPKLKLFYYYLGAVRRHRLDEAQAVRAGAELRSLGGNIQVAEVSAKTLKCVTAAAASQPPKRQLASASQTFQMRLPGGASVEFQTNQPELLALKMFQMTLEAA